MGWRFMDMQYTSLGGTNLRVSVAGFGCGGNSRLGLGHGNPETQSVGLVRRAIALGVNFFDTAEAYGTEEIVGKGIADEPRESLVISTKARILNHGTRLSPARIVTSLDDSLRRLRTDYVDIFHLHGISPNHYDYALDVLAPALLKQKQAGKFRHLGITETASRDVGHEMLHRAVDDEVWEVVMLAYHMLNQNARQTLFHRTTAKRIGTLLMFVVRNIFSQPGYLARAVDALIASGQLSGHGLDHTDPLGFLVHDPGANSVVDAAYRFARHEPGAGVVLFGTGSESHLISNVESILRPPLPATDVNRLYTLFGHLEGVGLDAPDHLKNKP